MVERTREQPAAALALAGRIAMAALFLFSGIGKVAAPAATIGYIGAAGLPLAPVGLALAVAVELGGGILLVLGLFTRPVAVAMAAFSIATAIFFHSDFSDQNMLVHFLKNVAIAGGFLQIVTFGPGSLSLDARRAAIAK